MPIPDAVADGVLYATPSPSRVVALVEGEAKTLAPAEGEGALEGPGSRDDW
jgi:hypothetical protein